MSKKSFIKLIISVISGLLFSLGVCMCLLPEWNSFIMGVILTSVGGAALLAMGIIAFIKNVKHRRPINWSLILKTSYGTISALIFGLGMSMIMVWNLIIWGTLVGIVGLVLLLFLIPMFFGFKRIYGRLP